MAESIKVDFLKKTGAMVVRSQAAAPQLPLVDKNPGVFRAWVTNKLLGEAFLSVLSPKAEPPKASPSNSPFTLYLNETRENLKVLRGPEAGEPALKLPARPELAPVRPATSEPAAAPLSRLAALETGELSTTTLKLKLSPKLGASNLISRFKEEVDSLVPLPLTEPKPSRIATEAMVDIARTMPVSSNKPRPAKGEWFEPLSQPADAKEPSKGLPAWLDPVVKAFAKPEPKDILTKPTPVKPEAVAKFPDLVVKPNLADLGMKASEVFSKPAKPEVAPKAQDFVARSNQAEPGPKAVEISAKPVPPKPETKTQDYLARPAQTDLNPKAPPAKPAVSQLAVNKAVESTTSNAFDSNPRQPEMPRPEVQSPRTPQPNRTEGSVTPREPQPPAARGPQAPLSRPDAATPATPPQASPAPRGSQATGRETPAPHNPPTARTDSPAARPESPTTPRTARTDGQPVARPESPTVPRNQQAARTDQSAARPETPATVTRTDSQPVSRTEIPTVPRNPQAARPETPTAPRPKVTGTDSQPVSRSETPTGPRNPQAAPTDGPSASPARPQRLEKLPAKSVQAEPVRSVEGAEVKELPRPRPGAEVVRAANPGLQTPKQRPATKGAAAEPATVADAPKPARPLPATNTPAAQTTNSSNTANPNEKQTAKAERSPEEVARHQVTEGMRTSSNESLRSVAAKATRLAVEGKEDNEPPGSDDVPSFVIAALSKAPGQDQQQDKPKEESQSESTDPSRSLGAMMGQAPLNATQTFRQDERHGGGGASTPPPAPPPPPPPPPETVQQQAKERAAGAAAQQNQGQRQHDDEGELRKPSLSEGGKRPGGDSRRALQGNHPGHHDQRAEERKPGARRPEGKHRYNTRMQPPQQQQLEGVADQDGRSCPKCGYVLKGQADLSCPVCRSEQPDLALRVFTHYRQQGSHWITCADTLAMTEDARVSLVEVAEAPVQLHFVPRIPKYSQVLRLTR